GKDAAQRGVQLAQAKEASGASTTQQDAGQAQATDAVDSSHETKLEEIVVTAQKREQRLIEVPMSVTALSGEKLDVQGIHDIRDLQFAVPGLSILDLGASGYRNIFLRGVGNSFGSSTMVGLYLDEADVTGFPFVTPDIRTYDLQRVEVLRGPQGTLYGGDSM